MAFFVLEDLTGSIEAVCFPRNYTRCKEHLQEGVPLIFIGSTEVTSTENEKITKFIIEKIQPLELESLDTASKTVIECPIEHMEKIINLIKEYKGSTNEVC